MNEHNDDFFGQKEEPADAKDTVNHSDAEEQEAQPDADGVSQEKSVPEKDNSTSAQQSPYGAQQNYGANAQWNQWQQNYHPPYQNGQPSYPNYPQGYYQAPYQQPNQTQWNTSEYHYSNVNQNPNVTPTEAQTEKPKMKKGTKAFLWVIGVVAAFFVFGFSIYGMLNAAGALGANSKLLPSVTSSSGKQSTDDSASAMNPNWSGLQLENQTALDGGNTLSAKQVYSQAAPSVVGVIIYEKNAELLTDTEVSEGSGIIMTQDGYIITNSHVIGDSKNYRVEIVRSTGETYSGTVVGFDTKTDLAVVKVEATGLPTVEFGNSDQLAVGDWVIAIGNPGGLEYANSLTRGVVSALQRSVEASATMKYIQTDAAINPGNSGGALLNMYGQVVGINTVKIVDESYEGMGFAIPINAAKTVVDDLIKQGYISGRVRLGVTCAAITQAQAQQYSVPQGILIRGFATDSDLASKGVQVSDIITKFNGKDVTTLNALYGELANCKPGDSVTLTIYRAATRTAQAKTFDVKVTLLEDKGETQQATSSSSSSSTTR